MAGRLLKDSKKELESCRSWHSPGRLRLKCDITRAETRFSLSAKQTSPFKSAGASVQSTTGSRGVRISGRNGSNAVYIMFPGSVKGTVYPLHSPVSLHFPFRASTCAIIFQLASTSPASVCMNRVQAESRIGHLPNSIRGPV